MTISLVKSILLLMLLTACSPIELYQAERTYEEAKASKNEASILVSLKVLASLDSQLYQSKLDEAKSAVTKRQKAKSLLADNNLYLAYLASHTSYRSFPTNESKKILLEVGGQLRYLLDVQSNIIKSFDSLPASLSAVISKYQNQPVLKWDVIKINTVLEQLGLAAKLISNSLVILKREKGSALSPEISKWQLAIQNQLKIIHQVEHYLISIALSSSAIELEKLNRELTSNSANLLSLVREDLAQETIQPHFIEANKEYQAYYNLNENLSLASSSTRKNSHAGWYKSWNNIEIKVLKSTASLSSYSKNSLNREKELKSFIDKTNELRPNLELGFSNLSLFIRKYEKVYNVIEKLNIDRMLLNYG